jgi:hypothetical protein
MENGSWLNTHRQLIRAIRLNEESTMDKGSGRDEPIESINSITIESIQSIYVNY